MKKNVLIALVSGLFILTSCSSGWSCKSRYVKADVKAKPATELTKKNA